MTTTKTRPGDAVNIIRGANDSLGTSKEPRMTNHTNSNSPTQSTPRTGYIAAVALTSGRVLGAYRQRSDGALFELCYVDSDANSGVPDPVAVAVEDIPQITRLLQDAASVMEGDE